MDALRIGIVGLDTSHVTAFTQLLNDESAPYHVPGGKVVAAFPGGSPDWPKSRDRVGGFTAELRDQMGVTILPTPEAVAEAVDMVFLESADGRVHLEQFKRILPFKRPTFIDKPLAIELAEAQEIVRLADEAGIAMFSSSSLRFCDDYVAALADRSAGALTGIDIFGPLTFQPTQPGWFWYGIHGVDMMVAALGAGCQSVRVTANEQTDLLVATWADGRVGTIRGSRYECNSFGATLHRTQGFRHVATEGNVRPMYACLIAEIMGSLPKGKTSVSAEQMLEVIRILEAANKSRESRKEEILSTGR